MDAIKNNMLKTRPGTKHSRAKADEEKRLLLEQIYVHDVYERMAPDFENQNHQPLSQVAEFLHSLDPGSIVADIGCGNGHYMKINQSVAVLGIDRCYSLLQAAQHHCSGFSCRADCLSIPYKDNSFDAVLSIGVIHHLVSAERQAKAINELGRILRPGGKILLYLLAWEQPKRKFEGQDILVPRCFTDYNADRTSGKDLFQNNQSSIELSKQTSISIKLESLLLGPRSFFHRLVGSSQLKSISNTTDNLPTAPPDEQNDWVRCDKTSCIYSDEHIEVPVEFQVREFPASSLFEISKTSNQNSNRTKSTSYHRKHVKSHMPVQLRSRDERFYHIFKKDEIIQLIEKHSSGLSVAKCSYKHGLWCTLLTKNTNSS